MTIDPFLFPLREASLNETESMMGGRSPDPHVIVQTFFSLEHENHAGSNLFSQL